MLFHFHLLSKKKKTKKMLNQKTKHPPKINIIKKKKNLGDRKKMFFLLSKLPKTLLVSIITFFSVSITVSDFTRISKQFLHLLQSVKIKWFHDSFRISYRSSLPKFLSTFPNQKKFITSIYYCHDI